MLVSLTIASVTGGGSAGCCVWLLTGEGAGVGVAVGFAAGVVRRRGVCATAIAAQAISVMEMTKSLVRFMEILSARARTSSSANCPYSFDPAKFRDDI